MSSIETAAEALTVAREELKHLEKDEGELIRKLRKVQSRMEEQKRRRELALDALEVK